jgi:hypothetical protein
MFLASVAVPIVGPLSTAATVNTAMSVQTEDNWNMSSIQIAGVTSQGDVPLATFGMHRFTGSAPTLDIYANSNAGCAQPGQIQKLVFTFQTADDDLRGGNDNLNITIVGAGLTQTQSNVNQSNNWANNSTHQVTISLNRPLTLQQLQRIQLQTTFKGGSGGDNWNMQGVEVVAYLNGAAPKTVANGGFHRFKGPSFSPSPDNTVTLTPIH